MSLQGPRQAITAVVHLSKQKVHKGVLYCGKALGRYYEAPLSRQSAAFSQLVTTRRRAGR